MVLARHVLWALPEPENVLARWVRLLKPGGRLVLVEGRWSIGGGLTPDECRALVRHHRHEATIRHRTTPHCGKRTIDDERYLVLSRTLTGGAARSHGDSRSTSHRLGDNSPSTGRSSMIGFIVAGLIIGALARFP